MPHIYWKTIIFSICITVLAELRLHLLTFKMSAKYNWVIDLALGTLTVATLINEKLGERWRRDHKILMAASFIIMLIVMILIER